MNSSIASMIGLLVLGLSLACASTQSVPVAATSAHRYSPGQVRRIMDLRDDGQGLTDVSRVVGGTRSDVRLAEKAEKARRRSLTMR
jgi:hypothetical protein